MFHSLSRLGVPILLGFLLDQVIGDPHRILHPVQIIGKLIDVLEGLFRRIFPKNRRGEHLAGFFCAFFVLLFSTAVPFVILLFFYHPEKFRFLSGLSENSFPRPLLSAIGFVLETFWCCQILALKSLREESKKVEMALRKSDLSAARAAVSMIVGRDVNSLDAKGVTKAAVETVAENTSDGVIAPLLFLLTFGVAGGFFYKAANTMDSMIAYRNERYRYFGTFAARLDDVLNFLPARLAGLLMILSAGILRYDYKNAARIFIRDRKKHDSPNSAHTEAAVAGALDLQLAGDAIYFGKLHKKPALGDPIRPIEAEDITRANHLAFVTSVLTLAFFWSLRLALSLFLQSVSRGLHNYIM